MQNMALNTPEDLNSSVAAQLRELQAQVLSLHQEQAQRMQREQEQRTTLEYNPSLASEVRVLKRQLQDYQEREERLGLTSQMFQRLKETSLVTLDFLLVTKLTDADLTHEEDYRTGRLGPRPPPSLQNYDTQEERAAFNLASALLRKLSPPTLIIASYNALLDMRAALSQLDPVELHRTVEIAKEKGVPEEVWLQERNIAMAGKSTLLTTLPGAPPATAYPRLTAVGVPKIQPTLALSSRSQPPVPMELEQPLEAPSRIETVVTQQVPFVPSTVSVEVRPSMPPSSKPDTDPGTRASAVKSTQPSPAAESSAVRDRTTNPENPEERVERTRARGSKKLGKPELETPEIFGRQGDQKVREYEQEAPRKYFGLCEVDGRVEIVHYQPPPGKNLLLAEEDDLVLKVPGAEWRDGRWYVGRESFSRDNLTRDEFVRLLRLAYPAGQGPKMLAWLIRMNCRVMKSDPFKVIKRFAAAVANAFGSVPPKILLDRGHRADDNSLPFATKPPRFDYVEERTEDRRGNPVQVMVMTFRPTGTPGDEKVHEWKYNVRPGEDRHAKGRNLVFHQRNIRYFLAEVLESYQWLMPEIGELVKALKEDRDIEPPVHPYPEHAIPFREYELWPRRKHIPVLFFTNEKDAPFSAVKAKARYRLIQTRSNREYTYRCVGHGIARDMAIFLDCDPASVALRNMTEEDHAKMESLSDYFAILHKGLLSSATDVSVHQRYRWWIGDPKFWDRFYNTAIKHLRSYYQNYPAEAGILMDTAPALLVSIGNDPQLDLVGPNRLGKVLTGNWTGNAWGLIMMAMRYILLSEPPSGAFPPSTFYSPRLPVDYCQMMAASVLTAAKEERDPILESSDIPPFYTSLARRTARRLVQTPAVLGCLCEIDRPPGMPLLEEWKAQAQSPGTSARNQSRAISEPFEIDLPTTSAMGKRVATVGDHSENKRDRLDHIQSNAGADYRDTELEDEDEQQGRASVSSNRTDRDSLRQRRSSASDRRTPSTDRREVRVFSNRRLRVHTTSRHPQYGSRAGRNNYRGYQSSVETYRDRYRDHSGNSSERGEPSGRRRYH